MRRCESRKWEKKIKNEIEKILESDEENFLEKISELAKKNGLLITFSDGEKKVTADHFGFWRHYEGNYYRHDLTQTVLQKFTAEFFKKAKISASKWVSHC